MANNQLPNPLDMSSGWVVNALTAAPTTGQADPNGGTAAALIVPDATNTYHSIIHNSGAMGPFATSSNITVRCIFKQSAANYNIGILLDGGGGDSVYSIWNLGTGALFSDNTTGANMTQVGSAITSLGSGWYACEIVVSSATLQYFNLQFFPANSIGQSVMTGNGTSGIYCYWPRVYSGAVGAERVIYVGSASGVASATPPTHQAGDLFVAMAYRDGANAVPTVGTGSPTAWTTVQNPTGTNSCTGVVVAKIAAGSAETTGTFTNATAFVLNVYRPNSGYALSIGASANGTGSGTTVTYPSLTLQDASGSSWVASFAGHRSLNTSLQVSSARLLARNNYVDATDEATSLDTGEGVSAFSSQSVAVGGTSSGWSAFSVELKVAASGYTLTAVNGALSETGTAANLLTGRLVGASNAGLGLAGQAANLIVGLMFAANPGALSFTGQPASLVYTPVSGYALATDAGTATLAGQSAGLLCARLQYAAAGASSLSGQNAALRMSRMLPAAESLAFVQGQAATLTKMALANVVLIADAGALAVAGSNATLRGSIWTPEPFAIRPWTPFALNPGTWAPIDDNPQIWMGL